MRSLVLLLAAVQLACAVPHGPSGAGAPPPKGVNGTQSSQGATGAPKSPAALSSLLPANGSAASCKLLPGDTKWPTDAQWKAALPNAVKRGPQKKENTRPDWHLSALNAADVQKAVDFANKNDLRLSIITTGHDFLSRNDAPSGLGLSLEKLRGVQVAESFEATSKGVPSVKFSDDPIKGANKITPSPSKQAAVTFGAGVTTQELNNALDKSGLFTMGAAHGEVGVAGGWGQSGGHGPFTSKYGLGADQVLEYQVVTADGQLRIANSVSNPDLFWALRGGGGGTFGVVVQATLKAFPSPKITGSLWWINTTSSTDTKSVFAPSAHLLAQLDELNKKKGVQGYFYVYPNAIQGIAFLAGEDSGEAKAKNIWAPILKKLSEFPGLGSPIQEHVELPNYKIFFDAAFGALETHGMPMPALAKRKLFTQGFMKRAQELRPEHMWKRHGPDGDDDDDMPVAGKVPGPKPSGLIPLDSRLLTPEHLLNSNLSNILEDAFPKMPQAMYRIHLTSGGKVWDLDKSGEETSVHPAWRKSLVHILGSGTPGKEIPDLSPLKRLASDTGAYSNEASWQEVNWKETFFGANYPKLLTIKEKYDPKMLFYVTPGVGADKLALREGRLCTATTPVVTVNNRVPEGDNKNIGKSATGNDFLTTWPKDQAQADAELNKAKAGLLASFLSSFMPAAAPAVSPVVSPLASVSPVASPSSKAPPL